MYIAYSEGSNSRQLHARPVTARTTTRSDRFHRFFSLTKRSLKFILLAAALLAVFSFGAIVQAYAGDGANAASTRSAVPNHESVQIPNHLIVEHGDTLWSIASSRISEGQDIRSYINKVKKLNQLTSTYLYEGQILLLP